jgi:hypothetical protein
MGKHAEAADRRWSISSNELFGFHAIPLAAFNGNKLAASRQTAGSSAIPSSKPYLTAPAAAGPGGLISPTHLLEVGVETGRKGKH